MIFYLRTHYAKYALRCLATKRILRGTALAENRDDLALNLPFLIPFAARNENRLQFGIGRLQAYAIMFFFLEEPLNRSAAPPSLFKIHRNHNTSIIPVALTLNHH